MRRTELIEAVEQLTQALNVSSVAASIRLVRGMSRQGRIEEPALSEVLKSLNQYSITAQNFSPATKELAVILDLKPLEDAAMWSKMFVDPEERENLLYKFSQDILFASKYLPAIAQLLEHETVEAIRKSKDDPKSKYKDKGILTVLVIEEGDRFSRPIRLVNVLESIDLMYEACALMMELPPEGLSVVACDSGSDKSFDFLGAAKILECVKDVILSLWDRIVFFREHKFSERLDLIEKSLPVIDRIGKLEKDKKLGPEQAELLRRNILVGVNKFMESGATIPELEERSYYSPRLLMSPVQKLLSSSSAETTGGKETDVALESEDSKGADINKLNEDEREELLRLLEKTRRIGESSKPEKQEGIEDKPD